MTEAESFPVVKLDSWAYDLPEPMGKPGKRWLRDPDGRSWLWKPTTVQRERSRTFPKGEDWAEKLASELARLLEIPAAMAELASLGGQTGVVIGNVLPPGSELDHGNQLLSTVVAGYRREVRQEVPEYRLDAIVAALGHFDVQPPVGTPEGLDAFGVFVLYLGLDALIGNTDRHHANWGATRNLEDGRMTLCASFDHATSLGFQLSDEARRRHLDEAGGMDRYARRARSRPFVGRPHLVDLFASGLDVRLQVGDVLARSLEQVDDEAIESLVGRVPENRMTQVSRRFVCNMWITNRKRILDVCRTSGR